MQKQVALYAVPGLSAKARTKIQVKPSAQEILYTVAIVYEIAQDDILSRSRFRKVSDARHVAVVLLLRYVTKNIAKVGRLLHRHRATVLNSKRQAETLLETDYEFAEKYEQVMAKLFNQ